MGRGPWAVGQGAEGGGRKGLRALREGGAGRGMGHGAWGMRRGTSQRFHQVESGVAYIGLTLWW